MCTYGCGYWSILSIFFGDSPLYILNVYSIYIYWSARSLTWTQSLLIELVWPADILRESHLHFYPTGTTGSSLHSPTLKWFLGIPTPVQAWVANSLLSSNTGVLFTFTYRVGSWTHAWEADTLPAELHSPGFVIFYEGEIVTEKMGTHSTCRACEREGIFWQLVHTR